MAKHILCDGKCIFNSATCNWNQKWNNKTCQCECESYRKCKYIKVEVLAHGITQFIADTSAIECK